MKQLSLIFNPPRHPIDHNLDGDEKTKDLSDSATVLLLKHVIFYKYLIILSYFITLHVMTCVKLDYVVEVSHQFL